MKLQTGTSKRETLTSQRAGWSRRKRMILDFKQVVTRTSQVKVKVTFIFNYETKKTKIYKNIKNIVIDVRCVTRQVPANNIRSDSPSVFTLWMTAQVTELLEGTSATNSICCGSHTWDLSVTGRQSRRRRCRRSSSCRRRRRPARQKHTHTHLFPLIACRAASQH